MLLLALQGLLADLLELLGQLVGQLLDLLELLQVTGFGGFPVMRF